MSIRKLPKIELRNARVKATSVRVLEDAIVLGLDLEL